MQDVGFVVHGKNRFLRHQTPPIGRHYAAMVSAKPKVDPLPSSLLTIMRP